MKQVSETTRTLVVSYLSIRRAIGVVGLALPVFLGLFGWLGLLDHWDHAN